MPRRPLILAIDDEPTVRRVLTGLLRGSGYEVVTAGDGLTGLQEFDRCHPDLVILDISMPGLSGMEVLSALRRHHATPVIMLSAHAEPEVLRDLFSRGADGHVGKPFRNEELLAMVQAKLRSLRWLIH